MTVSSRNKKGTQILKHCAMGSLSKWIDTKMYNLINNL